MQANSLPQQQVLKYINLARQYPKYYIGLIEQQLVSFVDELTMQLDKDLHYETIEGKSAWEEAKTFLNNQEPLRPFDFHPGLTRAANDHANDIVKNHSNGHQGSDGSTFVERIQRYCRKGKGSMIELLGSTHLVPHKNSIEIAIINLIVDDGVTNRGHRRALFSKDYKYIGADFVEKEEKVFSVIALSQANLQVVQSQPQSIATSTSHLKTLTQIAPSSKENLSEQRKSRENCIDLPTAISPVKEVKSGKIEAKSLKGNGESVWTLKNVGNQGKVGSFKRNGEERQTEQLYAEPSIFKEVNNSVYSNQSNQKSQKDAAQTRKSKQQLGYFNTQSKASIVSPSKIYEAPVKESSRSIRSPPSHSELKQSSHSIKSSQHSIKTEGKGNTITSQGFGTSSQVQKFKIKSTLASPFLKSNTFSSSFGASSSHKKVVQKKQTMRSWCQQQFLIRQVTTVMKYEDGTVQDFVQKHSILRNGESVMKEQSV